MKKHFDRSAWQPCLYKTPEELNKALEALGAKGCRIRHVHTIGMSHRMEPDKLRREALRVLARAGISHERIASGAYKDAGHVRLPCEVTLCEPVVFVFEDGGTLEIRPNGRDGLWMAAGQIDVSCTEGLNHRNIDSARLFQGLVGCALTKIETICGRTESFLQDEKYPDTTEQITWQFHTDGAHGAYFRVEFDDWFRFGLIRQDCFPDGRNEVLLLPYDELKQSLRPARQIVITDGHDSGSSFKIAPLREAELEANSFWEVRRVRSQICVDESDLGDFLYPFLERFFETKRDQSSARGDGCGDKGFDWYDNNLYSRAVTEEMLDQIERCAAILETDFDAPEISWLKAHFQPRRFDPDENCWAKQYTPEEADAVIRAERGLAVDFYRRFVRVMRQMLRDNPDCDCVCFSGP